jgi:hypothetical protein
MKNLKTPQKSVTKGVKKFCYILKVFFLLYSSDEFFEVVERDFKLKFSNFVEED